MEILDIGQNFVSNVKFMEISRVWINIKTTNKNM